MRVASPASPRRVSVVVPVYNGAATIRGCLEALRRQTQPPVEVLIVDNNSTDETVACIERFIDEQAVAGVKLLQEPFRGAAAARNRGVEAAAGDLVCMTDADCEPAPDWIERLAAAFGEDPTIGAVAGNIAGKTPRNVLQLFLCLFTLRGAARGAVFRSITPRAGGFPTANFAVRRALFLELGGFDRRIPIYGEDYDLCGRIYRAGYAIRYTEEALVLHVHRGTLRGMLRQSFGFGKAHALGLRRYYEPRLALVLPGKFCEWRWGRLSAWIDLASAEKKLAALLLLAWWQPLALLLAAAYLAYVERDIRRRMRQIGLRGGRAAGLQCTGLLLLKSAALTLGRWYGSVRYRSVCL
ncbi:MAG: glycosyltransferase family 2 protein [Candidatus Tectomicrobia bacterium]|nr:glycosyltransferase family 2 protein [Candidatus Tectomicrobia bacterium]